MSNINIKRAIENIRANTTVYTPVVEMIVNAIQAIEESGRSDGKVLIRAVRNIQAELDDSLPDITGFEIQDNGVGFTDKHRDSFDTLYTDYRITEGGKGFGRFTCLKYFKDLDVKSVYYDEPDFKSRNFSMGKDHDIIVREVTSVSEHEEPGTVINLTGLKEGPHFQKKISTVAKNLVELLLPYFITQDYTCPEIVLSEHDGNHGLRLNDFVNNEVSAFIQEMNVKPNCFVLSAHEKKEKFQVRVFKLYSPGNQKSKISLVAHRREVSGSVFQNYIPRIRG